MTDPEPPSKDELLSELLRHLPPRGMAKRWAVLPQPHTALALECQHLATALKQDPEFGLYLRRHPIIRQSTDTMLAQFAMVANVRWQSVPELVQPLARRGWHIARWLPTFLIVDGPLGRVLRSAESPLNRVLCSRKGEYPILAEARDAFNHETFRLVRNGVAHWAFLWQETSGGSQLVILDESSGAPTITVTLVEAEAMHLLAFSIVEALDQEVFRRAAPGVSNRGHS